MFTKVHRQPFRQPAVPRSVLSILLLAVVALAPAVAAERLIPFQGRVVGGDGQPLADGVYRVTFAIYDSQTGGGALNGWVESHENVSIIGGQINVLLGSLTSLDDPNNDSNTADAISFAGSGANPVGPRYLGIKIGEATNQEMVPRHELVPTFHARMADRVVAGGISTDQIADGAVTTVKLDPSAGLPVGGVVMWWGGLAEIPEGFEICDGTLPTTPGALLTGPKPDLRDRFPLGAGGSVAPAGGVEGGSTSFLTDTTAATTLTTAQMPAHSHSGGQHSHFEYGGIALGSGQCVEVAGGVPPGYSPGSGNAEWHYVLGYNPAREVQCPQVGVDVHFPVPPGGIGPGQGQPLANTGGGQSHTHGQTPPPFLSMHFIIRVK